MDEDLAQGEVRRVKFGCVSIIKMRNDNEVEDRRKFQESKEYDIIQSVPELEPELEEVHTLEEVYPDYVGPSSPHRISQQKGKRKITNVEAIPKPPCEAFRDLNISEKEESVKLGNKVLLDNLRDIDTLKIRYREVIRNMEQDFEFVMRNIHIYREKGE